MKLFNVTVGSNSEVVEAEDETDAIRVFRLTHPEGTSAPVVDEASLELSDSEISEITQSVAVEPVVDPVEPVVEPVVEPEATQPG